jgi:heme/copper-type cytochrome/quinol oxidase subunit 2
VHALSPQDFEQWLAERKSDIKAADEAAAKQRRQLEQSSP